MDLYVYTTLAAEFPVTGGIVFHDMIQVFRAYKLGASTIYQTLMGFAFLCYMVGYAILEIKQMIKMKKAYFYELSNLVDLTIVTLGWVTIVFFIGRMVGLNWAMGKLEEDVKAFVPMARTATLDDTYKYCVAFMNGIAIMKMILLLRLHRRVTQLMMTLHHTISPLMSFSVIFFVFLLAYASLSYLAYGGFMLDFSTFKNTLESLFAIAMGSFDTDAMMAADRVTTPWFFMSYMIIMNWIMINILITIIMDSHYANKDMELQWRDHEVIGHMIKQLVFSMSKGSNNMDNAMPLGI